MKRRTFFGHACAATAGISMTGCSSLRRDAAVKDFNPDGAMSYTTLGRTGIRVSRLGFGSHLKKELIAEPGKRDRMIKMGFEYGINAFDIYEHGGYHQYKPMGKSISGFRKDCVISLFCGAAPESTEDAAAGALKMLNTDYIDLYRHYAVTDEQMAALERIKKAGMVRAIGLVEHDGIKMAEKVERYKDALDFVMIPYNFHHNIAVWNAKGHPENDYSGLIPRCNQLGIGVIGIKPMGSDAMVELAYKEGFFKDTRANVAEAMVRHVLRNPGVDTTMPAMNSFGELTGNLSAAYKPALSDYEEGLLDRLSTVAAQYRAAYLPPHYTWLEDWATRRA